MSELLTAVLPLSAGMVLLFVAVWMAIMCGEVKTMMNRVFDIANGLFFAALMAFQIYRNIQAKSAQVPAPGEPPAAPSTATSATTPQQ